MTRTTWAGLLVVAVLFGGCSPRETPVPPTPTATWPAPRPYRTATPTVTSTPPPWPTGTPALPTPTPLYYTVREGDTLLGLALRFGIPLEALQKANPGLNPNAMPVGATVVIPLDPTYMPQLPTPTPPATVVLSRAWCYPAGDGGAWCFALVRNLSAEVRLHVAARLQVLLWGDGTTPYLRQALMRSLALHLPPGQTLPLVAYLEPPWARQWETRADLWRALPLGAEAYAERFAAVRWQARVAAWGPGRTWARLELRWQMDEPAAWVRAVAWGLDARGRPAAARAWTWEGPWTGPEEAQAELYLYTAGPPLDQVAVFVEAVRTPGGEP